MNTYFECDEPDEPDEQERAAIEARKAALRAEVLSRGAYDSGTSKRFWRRDPAPEPSTPAEHARRAIQSFRRATRGADMIDRAEKASRFRGVYKTPSGRNPWTAKIAVGGKQLTVGSFATEEDAARAYDQARIDAGRPAANFPDDPPSAPAVPTNGHAPAIRRTRPKPTIIELEPASPASSLGRELAAAAAIAEALAGLDDAQARRVLDFVGGHYSG